MTKRLRNYTRQMLLNWARLRYPDLDKTLWKMIRDNYFCRLLQSKFIFKDYVIKKAYKEIGFYGEFDPELRYVLPFAYWHYLNGTLKKTISCKGTKELYFFSPDHEERYDKRKVNASFMAFHIPNMTHSNSFSYKKWKQVPLKQHYSNNLFVYDKPLLVIANKYNIEWDRPPINFLDIETLDQIISACKGRYQIVYNRPQPKNIVEDNSEILDLYEHAWIRKQHPEVIFMDDLFEQYGGQVNNFNHLQLMVYANCNHFISIHGGTGALASYFGGINIILSDPAWGRETPLKEFETIFPRLSGATILHAHTKKEVVQYAKQHFLSHTQIEPAPVKSIKSLAVAKS